MKVKYTITAEVMVDIMPDDDNKVPPKVLRKVPSQLKHELRYTLQEDDQLSNSLLDTLGHVIRLKVKRLAVDQSGPLWIR
jgi:hypothetical protein